MTALILCTLLAAPAPAQPLECREAEEVAAWNLCLAKCYEEDEYHDVLGGEVRRTGANWQECRLAAALYCDIYDYELEDACWGAAARAGA